MSETITAPLVAGEVVEPTEPGAPAPDEEEEEAAEYAPLQSEDERAEAPSAPPSEKDMEKQMASLEREATRHANRVSEIMGEGAQDLTPCPRCLPNIPGFIFPAHLVPVPDDVVAAVKASLSLTAEPDYLKAPNARRCEVCDGWGRVLSGSRAPGQELVLCTACENGRGWVAVGGPPIVNTQTGAVTPEPEPQAVAPVGPETDSWGRPSTDPNFWIMPGHERF